MRLVPNMHVLVPLVVKPATQAHRIYGLAALTNLEDPKPVAWNAWNASTQPKSFAYLLSFVRV